MKRILNAYRNARHYGREADKVGLNPEEILELGIVCAQLGLKMEDLPKMATLYYRMPYFSDGFWDGLSLLLKTRPLVPSREE